ncbi:MAG TPA: magnesium-translocating P-type ATPase, partial [Polyangia bacterium]
MSSTIDATSPATPPPVAPPPLCAEGLTSEEAAARLAVVGHNLIAEKRSRPVAVQILLRFRNPLILLLLAASAVAGLTGDLRSFVVTFVMVLLSVGLDFTQEHRAGQAAERLRRSAVTRASVMRDGRLCEIGAPDIVPGDLVMLCAGDLVPADGLLIEARDLFANQALLTGEPYPVEKGPLAAGEGPGGTQGPLSADRREVLLMGCSITSGQGHLMIVNTGARTVLGQIGASLQRDPSPSAFEQGTRAFGMLILRLALIMVLFVILVDAWRGRPWLESFLFSVALAVGLTPELLPMVVSVTLSRGAMRLSRKKVLVKRLAAIHDLGSMDVLCTDKTGTLTEARIRLQQHVDVGGLGSPRVLAMAHLNSRFQSGLKSPMDEAIEGAVAAEAPDPMLSGDWRKLDEVPFDFERRRVSTLVTRGTAAPLLIVKGAFESILAAVGRVEDGGPANIQPLDEARRAAVQARCEALGEDGLRVLGIAWKELASERTSAEKGDERDLILAGLLVFQDPPKQSARAALRALDERGVAIKVLTGDDTRVARHVCREIGLAVEGVTTGAELQLLDDAALDAVVERNTVYCRVTPAQKDRIILSLKRRKHTVGFMGDGINDASALHSADVGISVDTAVDVAKEAADL